MLPEKAFATREAGSPDTLRSLRASPEDSLESEKGGAEMRHKSHSSRTAARAAFLGLAILVASIALAPQADAHSRRYKHRKHHRQPVVVVHRDAPRTCWTPRPRIPSARPIWSRPAPSWAGAPCIYVDRSPYYFRTDLGLYISGVAFDFTLTNRPPAGYVYYDPYCHTRFTSLDGYRRHARAHDHALALGLAGAIYDD
jgi:hypothetical protein